MTYEEAIAWLKDHHAPDWYKSDCKDTVAIRTAIKALEKQIPKKPIVDIYGDLDCMCPTCHRVFKKIRKGKMSARCPDCGQAIDWSDTE